MKRLLNKTLTVKQAAALVILPLAILGTIWAFSTTGKPALPVAQQTIVRDSVPEMKAVIDTSALGRLVAFIDSVNHSPEVRGGSLSFYLADADSGQPICALDIDRGLVPASVMKVVTTSTALFLLGPDFHYVTTLQYDGTIDASSHVLNGNIYIHGGGDPSLGAEAFGGSIDKVSKEWADAIRKLGIDSIAGCIIGDAELFERDPVPGGWAWEDMQSDYGAAPCGLNINENCYKLLLSASGNNVSLRTSPVVPGLKLYNQVVHNPAVGKSYAYVSGGPFQFERTVLGEVSSELEERSSLPDPALFCAQDLYSTLKSYGIGLRDSATTLRLIRLNHLKTEANEGRKTIASIGSPPLSSLVYHTNQISQNFYAETFLKTIGWKMKGYGSTVNGVSAVYNFWKNHGIDLSGMCMVDGSGLSRNNTITTHQLVEMLRAIAKDPVVFPAFYRSLPVAGQSGTIRKLADSTLAEGNVHAKSGTMSRVRAYAGYVHSRSGKLLCFAMIGNNTQWDVMELRDRFEQLFVRMAELP